jgi:pimeloyl-ACP methyl ester carboxylesterase
MDARSARSNRIGGRFPHRPKRVKQNVRKLRGGVEAPLTRGKMSAEAVNRVNRPRTIIVDGIWRKAPRFAALQAMLAARGIASEQHFYDSSGRTSLEKLGAELAERIRADGGAVNVVGFSMGGLVVRAAHLIDPALPIARAAFLNSPHRGSWMACALPFLPAVREMRPGSDFMQRLTAAEWNIPTLAVWCPGDLMVVPGRSARWHRAAITLACPVPAHVWPAVSKKIQRRVADFLCGEAVIESGRRD